jgi:ubiquitin thioesterase OTU1
MMPNHSDTAERPLRRVVPADNSCLFRAVAYLLHPEAVVLGCTAAQVPTPLASSLRTVVANTVLSDSDTYSEAMLGKSPKDYAQWIQKSESWGGRCYL